MALRRRKRDDETGIEAVDAAEEKAAGAVAGGPGGPYDEQDAPDDGIPRIDLGALRIPVYEGLEIQLDTAPDGSVRAVLVSERDAVMHLIVVAAPRSEGIWDEVRREIADSVRADGGKAEEVEGEFGTELTARVPSEGRLRPARFIGVDGPRWFLRGLFQGPAAADPRRAARLEELFRNLVVVRGPEPMPVRDSLPMQVPSDAVPSEAPEEDDDPDAPRALPMPERGPEITETR
jgi:Protein of unknown function (DUF3710)